MTATEKKLLVTGLAAAVLYAITRTQAGQAVTTDALVSIIETGAELLPRGLRNNNPGNIRFIAPPSVPWRGQLPEPDDKGFGRYRTVAEGVRALGQQLLAYERRGLNTVRKIIDVYAPASENNTTAYRNAVARRLNVGVDDPIAVRAVLPDLAAGIIHHENGQQPYTERELRNWVYLT